MEQLIFDINFIVLDFRTKIRYRFWCKNI